MEDVAEKERKFNSCLHHREEMFCEICLSTGQQMTHALVPAIRPALTHTEIIGTRSKKSWITKAYNIISPFLSKQQNLSSFVFCFSVFFSSQFPSQTFGCELVSCPVPLIQVYRSTVHVGLYQGLGLGLNLRQVLGLRQGLGLGLCLHLGLRRLCS